MKGIVRVARSVLSLGFIAAASLSYAQSAVPGAMSPRDAAHPLTDLGWRAVSDSRLDTIRGGFDLGNGLVASLGIERAVYINGNLVTYTNVNIPDIAHITIPQATALSAALSTMNVQNGPGNTFDPSSLGQTAAATVIQNTLNNQTIRNVTTLNVSVNTLNSFRNEGLLDMLQAGQIQALGH